MSQEFFAILFVDPFSVMNTVGLVAFALFGSSKAIREEFDLLVITIVGLAMASAGGVTRDLLVIRVSLALQSLIEISLGLFGVALAIMLSRVLPSPDTHPITLVADAIGLATFTTTGRLSHLKRVFQRLASPRSRRSMPSAVAGSQIFCSIERVYPL